LVDPVDTAFVNLGGLRAGAIAWRDDQGYGVFEFDPDFLAQGLDIAPLTMPLAEARRGNRRFSFRTLPRDTYRGLPGLVADSLPDRFGNRLINAWLARQGRSAESFSSIERLCYIGRRGIGALEYEPAARVSIGESVPVEIAELVRLTRTVISERSELRADLGRRPSDALLDLIRVGTSAGGGRPKAVIAINEATQEIRSGQVEVPEGFAHWLLKFDGIGDETLGDPAGYGRIEYAYARMASAAGIAMTECRLLEEGGRAHFMTRRFDRVPGGGKRHMQSLCAMAHFDFNDPASYSYEQVFRVMRDLQLPCADAEQQYRRMAFNVAARNQDDHTKNIAFLMGADGTWRLSPAFDLTYAYNPVGRWTHRHQLSVNGKRDGIEREDLLVVGREMNIRKHAEIIDLVSAAVANWSRFAAEARVAADQAAAIGATHRRLRE